MTMQRRRSRQSGFTLIEVLVAILIVSVGVLGVAGLQLLSLQNNTSAMFRTQAFQAAYDIMDRARANRDQDYSLVMGEDAPTALNCTAANCSPDEMRDYDLNQWRAALAANLPSGTGAVALDDGLMTVTVRWQDTRNAAADPLDIDDHDTDQHLRLS
ncbi:MAG: type IV pilus modification protein PilV [Gammaproteobacteria bacterium]|nr:type IV pilus modification protein PilV [Gammaproteobacteria bacterium]